jgi:hypothetical protein
MSLSDIKKITEADLLATEGEMVKYGIKRVPLDYFYYRQFRYTNLEDAVSQAKRDNEDL